MTTAIYPGTFDPITKGHTDLVKRATAGKQIQYPRSLQFKLKPIKNRFPYTVRSRAQTGSAGKAEFFAAPLATDNANSIGQAWRFLNHSCGELRFAQPIPGF